MYVHSLLSNSKHSFERTGTFPFYAVQQERVLDCYPAQPPKIKIHYALAHGDDQQHPMDPWCMLGFAAEVW